MSDAGTSRYFFDGTNNNLERDRDGKRIAAKEATVTPKRKIPFPSTEASHSNIVRLFDSFPLAQQASGYYGFYMPGVGTEFTDIGEETETSEGKAFALGGQARIIYGLLQVLNALRTTATSSSGLPKPLYDNKSVGKLAQAYDREVVGPAKRRQPA